MSKTITKVAAPLAAWALALPALAQTDSPNTGIVTERRTTFTLTDLINLLNTIANWFLIFIGVIAVIMILYSGFLFLTGTKDESREKAKNILIYGIIGVAVALLAFAIVRFVGSLI